MTAPLVTGASMPAGADSAPGIDEFAPLFDALLYAVSHDLKSPLLSIGLGAELLAEVMPAADDRARLAYEAMQRGVADMTRLLDALTLVSRARRRPLGDAPVSLADLLGPASAPGIDGVTVRVDPRVVQELLAALGGEPSVRVGESEVRLAVRWPDGVAACEGPPLEALLGALGVHSGTLVGTLAALQVQLERQGGALVVGGGTATALLPRG